MERIYNIVEPARLAWINLEESYDESDWRRKAAALQKRRWRVIRHAADA